MAINFLNSVNLNQNLLIKARIENQPNNAAAGTGVEGQLYYDTTVDAIKVWANGAWVLTTNGFVPYTGATTNVNLGSNNLTANAIIKVGGTSSQFLKADGSIDSNTYVALTSLSALAPLLYNNTTGAFSISQSTASTDGYLSSTDWATFNGKQSAITLTTTGNSGSSTLISNTLNVPAYTLTGLGGVPLNRQLTINGTSFDLTEDRSWSVGTVTSVAALTIGTSGTDLNSSVTNATTAPVITLNVPTANSSNRGVLSSTDWSTFNNKISSVTASSPLLSSGGVNPNMTIQQSSSSQSGFLSSTDWTTFNNKQSSGNYITALSGEATASGPGSAAVTLSNPAVTGKLLTGVNITGGTVLATDSMLTAFGKLQNQINSLIGGSIYQGVWNASTNTPTLTSSIGTDGNYYIVNVAGSTNLNGITDWNIGDWAIFHGGTWQKVDNTDAVSSVNGQTGAVSLTTDNISEGTTNLYYLDSRARSALSFAAGSGAYNSTTGVITIPTNTTQLTNGSNYITLASLSGTAPIEYNNTTGAISITQAGTTSNGFLSSTDWNTFNNKQHALNGTGFVKASGTTISYDNNVYALDSVVVKLIGDQSIAGIKTFSNATKFDFGTYLKQDTTTSYYTGYTTIDGFSNGYTINNGDARAAIFTLANNASRNYTFPDANGTFALTSDLSAYQPLLTNPITGTGTTNYLPKFTGSTALGNSLLYDNGTNIGVGTTAPNYKFTVIGSNPTTAGIVSNRFIGLRKEDNTLLGYLALLGGDNGDNAKIVGYNSSGTQTFEINASTSATYFNGGNFGIGTVPQGVSTFKTLEIGSRGVIYDNNDNFAFGNNGYNDGSWRYKQTGAAVLMSTDGGNFVFNTAPSGSQGSAFSFTERMRITSGGNVGINESSPTAKLHLKETAVSWAQEINHTYNGAQFFINLKYNGTQIGSISGNNTVTAYNVTSDYRLKQDFKSFNGLDLVSKIKVYDYEWKSDNSRMNGVIAHELQEVIPYAVTGEKDAKEMQQVDYSKLVPILVQAIQELKSEIEILKNK